MLNSRMQLRHATARGAHVLPMGVLEATKRSNAGARRAGAPRADAPGGAEDHLRRRFARSRVRLSPAPKLPNESPSPADCETTDTASSNVVGYRRLITELFGQGGAHALSPLGTAPRQAGARPRTLRLVRGGGR